MKNAAVLIACLLMIGCGVEEEAGFSQLSQLEQREGETTGVFSGCIDSNLFSPQECNYTCSGGRMAGYLADAEDYCREHGSFGDIACFCP